MITIHVHGKFCGYYNFMILCVRQVAIHMKTHAGNTKLDPYADKVKFPKNTVQIIRTSIIQIIIFSSYLVINYYD